MSEKNSLTVSAPPPPQRNQMPDTNAELLELQLRRERLQIQTLEQDLALKADALQNQENKKLEGQALRRSTVAQMKIGKARREFAQANCPHRKENGKTAVGGQRDSKRVNHWICQACLKEWTGNDPFNGGLPYALQPDPEKVGGPE